MLVCELTDLSSSAPVIAASSLKDPFKASMHNADRISSQSNEMSQSRGKMWYNQGHNEGLRQGNFMLPKITFFFYNLHLK